MRRALLLLLLLAAAARGGDADVDGARAFETLKTLSSDEFQGRKSGLPSGTRAEAWMADRVLSLGLGKPNGFTVFHDFKASVTEEGPGPRFEVVGGSRGTRALAFLSDYVALLYSGRGDAEAEVVFAGYGIHAPEKGRDDYAGLDVRGKIVMAVRGGPPRSDLAEERFIGYKSSAAADLGAVGFLLVEGDHAVPGTIQEKYHRETLPAVWLSRAAADDLLARAGKGDLAAQVKALEDGRPASFPLPGVKARLTINARLLKDRPLRNVVGIWPGETDEFVVLGAHLDHVGTDAAGNVYNGADDNASGSAMLLEVARAIVAQGKRFRRSILFVWFAGEEQGLLGSWAFVKTPPVPLEKVAAMINTDMVGQGTTTLRVGGAEVYPREAGFLGGFALEGFDVKPFRAEPNSDHYPFQTSGVPAFFVHTEGPHPNYHQPGDDWGNIRPELLETAGRFVKRVAEIAADSPEPFCRPLRKEAYLWNDAPVVDLLGKAPSRVVVKWFGGGAGGVLKDLDAELTRLEAEGAPQALFRQGGRIGSLLNELRPTEILAVRGDAYALRRLGVTVFEPPPGAPPPPKDVIAWLPEGADPSSFPGPILLPAEKARMLPILKDRKEPWLAVAGLDAKEIRDAVTAFGIEHVLVVPDGRDPLPVIAELAMKPQELRALLGGNFIRLLE
ncbi:MAG TPA: M20/M25/M40 family metallo-hydrolase [Planctomycetota bacterium]|nr:M20/M25/M40 family metallo-hydrolase [Planctomycetota bacterium]